MKRVFTKMGPAKFSKFADATMERHTVGEAAPARCALGESIARRGVERSDEKNTMCITPTVCRWVGLREAILKSTPQLDAFFGQTSLNRWA